MKHIDKRRNLIFSTNVYNTLDSMRRSFGLQEYINRWELVDRDFILYKNGDMMPNDSSFNCIREVMNYKRSL